jgi:F0F1-type ATP synthase membrane subunit b/b'
MEERKKNAELKIIQMKEGALREIKNTSVQISMQAVASVIKNSIDKNKLDKIYSKSLDQAKSAFKNIKA